MQACLTATAKFKVWELNNHSVNNIVGKIIVGGRRITLSDVFKVSCNYFTLALEKTIEDKPEPSIVNEVFRDSIQALPHGECLPVELCRAILFVRVVSLLQEKSGVRLTIVSILVDLLNNGIVPCFKDEISAGAELVSLLLGQAKKCYFNQKIVDTESIETPAFAVGQVNLTLTEGRTLLYGQFYSTGICALLAGCVLNVFHSIDILASFSCEAVGARVDAFDSLHFDVNRPHRGQIMSATTLRLMLEGSKCVGDPSSTGGVTFAAIPQVHGPAHEAMTAVSKMMELELNSAEGGPVLSPVLAHHPAQSYLALDMMKSALLSVLNQTLDRQAVLSGSALARPSLQLDNAADMYILIKRLSSALATEFKLAISSINARDTSTSKAVVSTSGDAEADSDAPATTDRAASNKAKKPVLDDESRFTPEQRAKAEAKRREKALKAEQKAKAKEAKKGISGALVLGVGTTLLRSYVMKTLSSTEPSLSALEDLFDPTALSGSSFTAFCIELIEQISSSGKHKPKIPKGARDFGPEQMMVREQVFTVIRRVFKRHGAVEIDTPVFELREVLMGKYGEDSKLIYDLADQGGELLSLRYDLTVPFARFLAMNSVGNIKRYHIAKVYRRDNPQLSRGRYREFYQCDFDIAGSYPPMVPDAEVITVATEILADLPIGLFMIKLNHRGILDAIFEICGVPADKFRTICSAVDKLDKASWDEVRKEMVEEKGLPGVVADRIGEFVLNHGEPKELLTQLTTSRKFGDHKAANSALVDLGILFEYLEAMGSLSYVHFDLSLARGLDYYTGVIYEVVLVDSVGTGISVGSVAAGGRYDNLVGMFSASGHQTPCVGVSIGIERVFAIMEKKATDMGLLKTATVQVYVASIGAGLVPHRMRITKLLWAANISAEYSHQDNPKFKKQLDEVLERGVPYMVVFGEEELTRGSVKVKVMSEHSEVEVPLNDLVAVLTEKGCPSISAGADLNFLNAMK